MKTNAKQPKETKKNQAVKDRVPDLKKANEVLKKDMKAKIKDHNSKAKNK